MTNADSRGKFTIFLFKTPSNVTQMLTGEGPDDRRPPIVPDEHGLAVVSSFSHRKGQYIRSWIENAPETIPEMTESNRANHSPEIPLKRP